MRRFWILASMVLLLSSTVTGTNAQNTKGRMRCSLFRPLGEDNTLAALIVLPDFNLPASV